MIQNDDQEEIKSFSLLNSLLVLALKKSLKKVISHLINLPALAGGGVVFLMGNGFRTIKLIQLYSFVKSGFAEFPDPVISERRLLILRWAHASDGENGGLFYNNGWDKYPGFAIVS